MLLEEFAQAPARLRVLLLELQQTLPGFGVILHELAQTLAVRLLTISLQPLALPPHWSVGLRAALPEWPVGHLLAQVEHQFALGFGVGLEELLEALDVEVGAAHHRPALSAGAGLVAGSGSFALLQGAIRGHLSRSGRLVGAGRFLGERGTRREGEKRHAGSGQNRSCTCDHGRKLLLVSRGVWPKSARVFAVGGASTMTPPAGPRTVSVCPPVVRRPATGYPRRRTKHRPPQVAARLRRRPGDSDRDSKATFMLDDIDLTACLRGDKQAWNSFVERSVGVLFAAVHKVLGKRGPQGAVDVEDIVQDVFAKLVRADYRLLRQFDPEKASLVTYLTLIARSTTLDAVKRRQLDTTELKSEHHPTQEELPREPRRTTASGTIPLEVLSERQRLILHLLLDRGMSVVEVAAALAVDPQTIRSAKHKALTRLRESLAAGDESRETVVEPQ